MFRLGAGPRFPLGMQSSYRRSLLDRLVSHWKLDESAGASRLDTHGVNHLTDFGTVTQAAGKIGQAASYTFLAGNNLVHSNNVSLQTSGADFTIAAWCWAPSGGVVVVSKGDLEPGYSQAEYSLDYYADGGARFAVGDGDATFADIFIHDAFATSVWSLVVGWRNAASKTIFFQVNNGPVERQSYAFPEYTSSLGLMVGDYNNLPAGAEGRLDSVSFWKRILSDGERSTLWNNGSGLNYPFRR